jgi:hypothetical protein
LRIDENHIGLHSLELAQALAEEQCPGPERMVAENRISANLSDVQQLALGLAAVRQSVDLLNSPTRGRSAADGGRYRQAEGGRAGNSAQALSSSAANRSSGAGPGDTAALSVGAGALTVDACWNPRANI